MSTRKIDRLKPHPANDSIYGDKPDRKLIESIKDNGILNPLLIAWDGRIISGHRRFVGAQQVGLIEVPVVVFASKDEDVILAALIESNRQRKKTKAMIAKEAAELAAIERRSAEARQEAAQFKTRNEEVGLLGASVEDVIVAHQAEIEETVLLPVVKPVHTHVEVAEKLGVSPATAQNAIVVGEELKRLESSEKLEDQERAGELLVMVNERGFKPAAATVMKPSVNGRGRGLTMVESTPSAIRATFNQTNDKVSWAKWTWNPVTGCLHDCPYCYARDIAERFYPQGFAPTFHEDRLAAPRNTRLPKVEGWERRVFTCSMADLFGKWVPQDWIDAVFTAMRDSPQWEYLCLTKFPQRLAEIEWPENVWVGTTVDRQHRVEIAEKSFRGVKAGVKWLSCEPMLEPLKFQSLEMFDWVVIGGASRSNKTPEFWPPVEWVFDLYQQAREAGCKIWLKPNTFSPRTPLVQEMPR